MSEAVPVRIQFVGLDDPEQPRFPPNRAEIIRTPHSWNVGDEMLPTYAGLLSGRLTSTGAETSLRRTSFA
jgi:hypothetical protein